VIVAVSGGPDSTALLHLLSRLAPELDLRLEVAHFDHGVRASSSADGERTGDLSARLGLPFHLGAPDRPLNVDQASLRDSRYGWLAAITRSRNADRLAVGHHADDQAETVLFRVMRGTDLRGLGGIPARREAIVRPLLPFRRWELIEYLELLSETWIEDPSNADPRWVRARLRADVLPAVELACPGATARLVNLGRAAQAATDLVEGLAARLLGESVLPSARPGRVELARDRLLRAGTELQSLALIVLARTAGIALSAGGTRAGVEFISVGRSGSRVAIGGGLEVAREFDRIVIGGSAASTTVSELEVHEGTGAGVVRIGERELAVRWRPAVPGSRPPGRIAVAVSPGHYPLMFRGWRHGDRIRLAGGTRKLKKLFGDHRIPVSERVRVPVLADRLGNVLWVEGLATADAERGNTRGVSLVEFDLRDE